MGVFMAGISLQSKNVIEKALPDIRLRTSELPDVARIQTFGMLYAKLLYLRDAFGKLAEEIYRIENQEVLCLDDSTNTDSDRMRT